MTRRSIFTLVVALAPTAGMATDNAIAVSLLLAQAWEFPTHVNQPRARPGLAVGFWQRASGAKPGVGAHFGGAVEYQLPEAAPQRVRSATFQFTGRQSQCAGAEPVVIDVFAYAGDGRSSVSDASAGSRVAQLSAGCADNPAFARPIDVTAIVRQLSVPAGVRHIGFNLRKANNRQGPGLFNLAAGKLTIVLADRQLSQRAAPMPAPAMPMPNPAHAGVRAPVVGTAQTVMASTPRTSPPPTRRSP